jgi:gliding motility-associated transport system permease protein
MRTILAITRKELETYFASPIAYVVVTLFLILSGIFFYIYLLFYLQNAQMAGAYGGGEGMEVTQTIMRPLFSNLGFFGLIIFPLITMRLISEEKKLGTYELLMTSPVTTVQLVLGKFFGAAALVLLILLLTAVYPLVLSIFGHPDIGPILTGYLGLFLLGSAFLGVGLLCSSLTENQIVAAVLGFVFLVVFWILNFVTRSEAWYGKLAQYASIYQRFDDFTQGVINLNDVFYYVSFAFFALFVTGIVLQSQRWK